MAKLCREKPFFATVYETYHSFLLAVVQLSEHYQLRLRLAGCHLGPVGLGLAEESLLVVTSGARLLSGCSPECGIPQLGASFFLLLTPKPSRSTSS